ncbi:MAG: glycosyltransferase family 4 protein [Planctomycetota bacterium]|nr:glycosyltransferase family 4 protein [Planctomycetota bacterium]
MSVLKILMLNYEFPPIGGGAGQAHLCLLKEFAGNSELQIDVLTSTPEPGYAVDEFAGNINIHKVGVHKKNLHHWRKIEVLEWLYKANKFYKRLLKQNDYDFVHAFFGFPTGWLCYRTANKLPYIISLRGSDVPGKHARLAIDYKILGPLFKLIWKKASALVACSEGLKERSLRFLPIASIDVIPNGVDLELFSPAHNKDRSDTFKLLTVGRLSVTKRVEMLIDAVEILHGVGMKLSFTIVGGGAGKKLLRQIISAKKLDAIIKVAGRIEAEKMPAVYRQSDLFISASMQEGMSNAMLEAMASGLPIVTTRCEGVEELIADNGVIAENDSAISIADAVRKAAGDTDKYNAMCATARKKAEQFRWSNVGRGYLQIYQRVMNKRS